jgi:alkylation response protein AidB-like acyl-CoA dehydrogenase
MMKGRDVFSLPNEWIDDETREIVQTCRKMVEKEIFPVRAELDEDWKDHKIYEPLLKKIQLDFGFQRAPWPKEYGGLELNAITYCLLLEELCRGDSGLATAADCVNWSFMPILAPDPNEQLIKKFACQFCQSENLVIACAAITDERSGSDVENIDGTHGQYIATTAKLDGDDWVINGHKLWPTNSGGVADLFAVFCTTNPGVPDDDAFAIIYVPADTPGVTQGGPYQKAGMSGDKNGDVWFENVRIPKENRAHQEPGLDAKAARLFINAGNIGASAQAIGVMRNCYELVREWCDLRVVGGKVLKEHSITAGILADLAMSIEVSRSDTYMKARMMDHPELYDIDPAGTEFLAKTRANKLFVTDQMTIMINKAMDLMGSYGYAREGAIEKHWRDSKIISLWMGGRSLAKLDIARHFYDCKTF